VVGQRHREHDCVSRYAYALIEDPPSGTAYESIDINNRGEIVGWYNDAQGFTTTGFSRSRNGRFAGIDVPGSQVTAPFKINDRRQVVGIYVDAGGILHGFLWDDGDFTTIDVRGAAATAVYDINNRGQMVGSYVDAAGGYHGFLRDRSGAVNTLPDAPGADATMGGTLPVSINDRGHIVGGANDARGGSRGFLLERGAYTMIDGSGDATYTRALDINNRGEIVGDYGTRPSAGARSSRVDSADRRAGSGLLDRLGASLPTGRATRANA
jgi:uncharacterized membrane protein